MISGTSSRKSLAQEPTRNGHHQLIAPTPFGPRGRITPTPADRATRSTGIGRIAGGTRGPALLPAPAGVLRRFPGGRPPKSRPPYAPFHSRPGGCPPPTPD